MMSKNRKRKFSSSGKNQARGEESGNPFDRVKRSSTNASFRQKKVRRSKFVNNNVNEPFLSPAYNKRTQKLQLYNLNEPLQLTHKNEPIEEHYEDDVSDNSEDDFRYDGDIKNIPQALEEHKERRAIERKLKEEQRTLLSKLDTEFENLDMTPFMRPKKGTLECLSEKPSPAGSSVADKYEENLHHLMAAPLQSKHGGDLLKQLYAAESIAEKCIIAKRFMNGNYVTECAAASSITEVARPLCRALESQATGYPEFCSHFEVLTELVHYLCQRNTRGYKEYFSKFLGGVYVSLEQGVNLSTEAIIVLFLLLKVMKTDSALYKGALIVLERAMDDCELSTENLARVRLLLAASFSSILETGLYMPSFYKFCMRIITKPGILKLEVVEAILDMVTVTLRLLSSRDCHVYPICLHIISPNIASMEINSDKLERLKKLLEELLDVSLRPGVVDIYLRPKVEPHIPKYSSVSAKGPQREQSNREEKDLYKSMKREFLRTALADAKRRSLELQKKREKAQDRYKKVVREAMMEQEMLRKEFTKPT